MENKEICSVCGGKCCKKSGCDYAPTDFKDLGINHLYEILMGGKISIVSTIKLERLPNGKKIANPILLLRARNIERPIVDLLSMKKTCSQLTETGCSYSYEERPSGGKNLIPVSNGICYPSIPPTDILDSWSSYQKTLSKLVKRITGNTVDQQFSIDVEKLFIDVLNENFEGVTELELMDIKGLLPHLIEIYPEQYKNATNKTGGKVKKLIY